MEQKSIFSVNVEANVATGGMSGCGPAPVDRPVEVSAASAGTDTDTCTVRVVRKHMCAVIPRVWTGGSAGCDLHTVEGRMVGPGSRYVFRTGLMVELPRGTYGQIVSRSSWALKGMVALGGVIDQDYRGEIKIIMANFNNQAVLVEPGDRIAQLIVHRIFHANVVEVSTLGSTNRQDGGLGSTG